MFGMRRTSIRFKISMKCGILLFRWLSSRQLDSQPWQRRIFSAVLSRREREIVATCKYISTHECMRACVCVKISVSSIFPSHSPTNTQYQFVVHSRVMTIAKTQINRGERASRERKIKKSKKKKLKLKKVRLHFHANSEPKIDEINFDVPLISYKNSYRRIVKKIPNFRKSSQFLFSNVNSLHA